MPTPPAPARTVEINLHPAQAAFLRDRSTLRGFVGGRGAGKSYVGSYDLLRRAEPNRLYCVVAPTYPMLSDATFRTFRELGERLSFISNVNLSTFTVTLGNGAGIIFRSAEHPDRLRGPNLSGVWMDEASQCDREAFDVVLACLREGGRQGWLSATFTPWGRSHWTYQVFGKGAGGASLFHARTAENPFLPAGFAETVRRQYTGLRAEQELEGRFVDIEGAEWPPEWFGDSLWFDAWPQDIVLRVVALDPSKGKASKFGDYSAFVHAALSSDMTLWVDADLRNDRDASAIVATGVEMCRALRPDAFVIETNQFQELFLPEFQRVASEQQVMLPIHACDNRVNKEVRIRRLTPYLSERKLRFRGGSAGASLLVEQMRAFPKGSHDDGPDALEMAIRKIGELASMSGGEMVSSIYG